MGGLLASPVIAEEVDKSLDADATGHVDIYNTSGNIEVAGWSRNSVQVTGEIGDDVEELVFERDGDHVLIKVKVPRHHGRDIDADILVRVPEGSSIDVSGVSADIEVAGVRGDQSLQTVSGDVEATGISGDLEAASVSGDVEVEGTGADAETSAGTVSGDVIARGLSGNLEAESVSGDVIVEGGAFDRVYFETVNGDLNFSAELRRGGKLAAESVNGDVDIKFDGDVSASFDLETFNGDIENCFGPKPQRTSRYAPGLELSFTVGDGDGRVTIETLNGGIHICNQ
ncbi:MAG: DUF4097 domain-containing protein [Gammaproteobacteria bacterium]|nr:DUF4097 domain-containing protein [Gammaproteobacteria bacterium]